MRSATAESHSLSSLPIKPSDRVMAYLEEIVTSGAIASGGRLPTTREISGKIQVSPGTVRNVFQKLSSEGRIEIRPGSGTFWVQKPASSKRERVVGINTANGVEIESHKQWMYKIYGGMTQRALQDHFPMRFKLIAMEQAPEAIPNRAEIEEELREVDGFILFPSSSEALVSSGAYTIGQSLSKRGIPCIYYNPPYREATSDFVSPDYFGAAQRLGRVWRRTGRQRILIVMAPGTEKSISCQLMYGGILSGLGMEQSTLPEVYKLTVGLNDRQQARDAFQHYLQQGGGMPDAVYAMTDELALGVMDVALKRGIAIPDQLSIVGGNGANPHESAGLPLSANYQPVEEIGERLISLLIRRIRHPEFSMPGVFINMPFRAGMTTSAIENKTLLSSL